MAERRVTHAPRARADLENILTWTGINLGLRQADVYRMTFELAVDALRSSSEPLDSRRYSELLRYLHVKRKRRRGAHMLFYRLLAPDHVEIVRILHERMDFNRHLPAPDQA